MMNDEMMNDEMMNDETDDETDDEKNDEKDDQKDDQKDDDEELFCMCFRIHPSIDRFQSDKGIEVKFKDDMPSSTSTS